MKPTLCASVIPLLCGSVLTLCATSMAGSAAAQIVVTTLPSLIQAIAANPQGSYVFANDYDASADGPYSGPPISTSLQGSVDFQGHTISNLTINSTAATWDGLFRGIDQGATVQNLRLSNETIIDNGAYAGGVAALNNGTIDNVTVQATITSSGNNARIGAVAAQNGATGQILAASVSGTETNSGLDGYLGGIVGVNLGLIQGGRSSMTLTSTAASGVLAGEIAGVNGASTPCPSTMALIEGSTVSGTIVAPNAASSSNFVGGVAGANLCGQITGAISSVAITGGMHVGGVVGHQQYAASLIRQAAFTGSVNVGNLGLVANKTGGVAGDNYGQIDQSFSIGRLVGTTDTGLVAGTNESGGSVTNSYGGGSASGTTYVGALGYNLGSYATSYSYGAVTGSARVGCAAGAMAAGAAAASVYFDTIACGTTGVGAGSGAGISGESTATLQSGVLPSGFSPSIWSEKTGRYPQIKSIAATAESTLPSLIADISASPGGTFFFVSDYDASVDGVYTGPPIYKAFTGFVDFTGHTISNLTIDTDTASLFRIVAATGTVQNLNLSNETITGAGPYAAGVAAANYGQILNVNVNAHITNTGASSKVAGVVGLNNTTGNVDGATVTGDAHNNGSKGYLGGIAGENFGVIQNVDDEMRLTSMFEDGALYGSWGGGIVGANGFASPCPATPALVQNAVVGGSISSADVASASNFIGGAAGVNLCGTMTNIRVKPTVAIIGGEEVGGVVGHQEYNVSLLQQVIFEGQVNVGHAGLAAIKSGGLVGDNFGTIIQSMSTGAVVGLTSTGLLAGTNEAGGRVLDSWAGGSASGAAYVGAIGYNSGAYADSYTFGAVSGSSRVGCAIGNAANAGSTSYVYFDTTACGTIAVGGGSASGVTGVSTATLQSGALPTGLPSTVWSATPGSYPQLLGVDP